MHVSLITKSAAPAFLLALAPFLAGAQSDDFSSGDDSQWTRQDPIYEAATAYELGLGPQVTFSFPASGGYRIQTAPSPMPTQLGPGRGGSLREDVTYGDSFYVAADLLSWADSTQQVAGLLARVSNPGPGTTSGYLFGYSTPGQGQSMGQIGIYLLSNEAYLTLSSFPIRLYPTNSYHLAFFSQGGDLEGRVYLLPNTNTPLLSFSANDSMFSSGFSGLVQADQTDTMDSATDATYGHYRATDFCVCDQPQNVASVPGGVATLTASAIGTAPLSYQWTHYGTNLVDGSTVSGSSTPTLTLSNVTAADAGGYAVVVTDASARSTTSAAATVSVLSFTPGSPNVSVDFENGTPSGTSSRGTAYIGTDDAGGNALHLTDAINSQQGSFVIGDMDNGSIVRGFDAQFDVLIGGSTSSEPADGLSFTWAGDLPAGSFGEGGSDTGLTVTFEVWSANSSIPGPGIDVKYRGAIVAQTSLPLSFLESDPNFVPAHIHLSPGGMLTVVYNSVVVYNNLSIPGLAGGMAGASFGWGARTGLGNDNFWLDNVRITTNPQLLNFSHTSTGVSFNYYGVLQGASNAAGPYTDVPNATSPYSFSFPAGAGQMFWRARSP